MGMIGDFYVRLSAVTAPYTKSLIEATDEGEAFAEANKTQMESVEAANESGGASFGLLGKAAVGIGAAFIGVSAISMKWATSFQSAMESVHTQAGVAQSQIAGLSNGVLDLAGKVGFSPDSLAEALYHIESSFASVGITGPKALQLLQVAAEGAATGHANLVDVTNALDAAVASGIPGVENFSQAMGVLNATVGSGDMEMQDLANAFSTGVLANVKSYGLSITDVGAALAVFGDNNIRGQNAATDLRMAVQALAVPAKTAAGELEKMGLSESSLATVMSKQGLLPALELLKQKMTAAGVTAQTQGAVLTDLFGKKAGAGIVVLYDQLDRLKSKYPELTKGANQFGNDWIATKNTVKQQLNEIGAGIQAAGIKFGQFLLPLVSKGLAGAMSKGGSLFGDISKDFSQFTSGFTGQALKVPVTVTPVAGASPSIMAAMRRQLSTGAVAPPSLTPWQQIGVTIHQVSLDFEKFGKDVRTAADDAVRAAKPVEQVLAQGLGTALVALGKVLANVVGPALEKVFGFLASHQGLVKIFAEVILGGLVAKLLIIKSIDAATGITKLATSIVSFPAGQVGQIGTAFGALKTSAGELKTAVLDSFGKIKSAVTGTASVAAAGGSKFVSAVKGVGTSVAEAASTWGGKIAGAVKNIMPTKLDAKIFLQSVKDVGSNAASTVAGWGGSIASAASSAATGLATLGKNAGTAVASMASSAWSSATEALSGMAVSIGEAATAAWGWVTATAASALAAGQAAIAWTADKLALIGTAIAEKAAAAAQWLLDAAMDANPVGLIVLAIFALIGIFVLLWTKCAWFRNLWKGLWADIKRLFGDAVSFVKSHVDLLVGIIALPVLPLVLLAQHWRQVWSDIKSWSLAAWHFLDSDVFQPVAHIFTQTLPAALRTLGQFFSNVWSGIKQTVSSVWRWIDSNVLQPAEHFFASVLGGALATARGLWNSFWNGVRSILQGVWSVIRPIINAISGAINTISSGLGKVQGIAGSVVSGVGHFLSHFDNGGFVPGAKGAAQLAVVHGGEYVVSNDMLAGRAPVDNRVLAGVLAVGGGGSGVGGGSNVSALAVGAPSGGGGTVVYQTIVNVAGNVTSEKKLVDVVRTQILQYNLRNSNNGLALA